MRGNQKSPKLTWYKSNIKSDFCVETSSPSKDQGIRLAPATTAPDDEVPAAAHGPRLSSDLSNCLFVEEQV